MKYSRIVVSLMVASLLSACATNPPVTVRYYLPQSEMVVTVIRSVTCLPGNRPRVLNTVTTKVVHGPDTASPQYLPIKSLDGNFTNTEVGFTFAEDGRLTGLNSTQTGKGGEIIQGALAVGGKIVGLAGGAPRSAVDTACQTLADNFKDGVASVTFSRVESFSPFEKAVGGNSVKITDRTEEIEVIASDAEVYDALAVLMGSVCLKSYAPGVTEAPVVYEKGQSGFVDLNLREPARVRIEVLNHDDVQCGGTSGTIWKGTALVSQRGVDYPLPIPSAPMFGKQTFKLGLADSGAITSLSYGKESGVASAISATEKAIDTLDGSSEIEKAALLKARADIIAQQERLLRCQKDPEACV